MEKLFEASLLSITLSVVMGIIVALLVTKKWQFPKNSKVFIVTIIINIISPFIGQSSYIFGVSDGSASESAGFLWTTIVDGPLEGIIVAYLLFSFFLTVNVIYLLKNRNILPAKLAK